MIKKSIGQSIIILGVLITYTLLGYLSINDQFKLDFSTFYSSLQALSHGNNPYASLTADYLAVPRTLPHNLCPPFFLILTYPLGLMSYHPALLCWLLVSFISGLIGARISFSMVLNQKSLSQYGFLLTLFYLMLFSTIMNLAIGQIGSLLFLFVMAGYHFYLKKHYYWAGIFWATIISIKLFPGLLFFYALAERRFKLILIMLGSCLCFWAIPFILYGAQLYLDYFNVMTQVSWYADSWNASIYGFLFRLFTFSYYVPNEMRQQINLIYLFVFPLVLGIYYWLLKSSPPKNSIHLINHYRFCLTLVFMLLLSPLGWIYYSSLLILPLALCWFNEVPTNTSGKRPSKAWLFCFFLINCPFDYVATGFTPSLLMRISIYSLHFYGLLLLAYLMSKEKKLMGNNLLNSVPVSGSFIAILLIGMIIPAVSFVLIFSKQ
ncbi:glycosyltransferase family 87 protein [Legionella worsleiensis]|uniref:glycosyltransferase family 87 protein n=1 Tax=Legionella worsleiensis TaxID=45076 RepID=UPI00072FDB1B|nr:glycosyltransferase family 87 protein [Legionella worsleiensis]